MSRKLAAFVLLCTPIYGYPEVANDCGKLANERKGIIEVREFSCETDVSCAVGVWAPLELEERQFGGFTIVLNYRGPDDYGLALGLPAEVVEDEVVGFLYGTVEVLKNIRVGATYWSKSTGCALQSNVQLNHNKALNSQASPAGTPKSGAH